jgi:molybdopterin molybdotransferase
MLTPSEALARVLERIPAPERADLVPLGRALGRCLALEAVSDVDIPPFEKSMMDGFAVRSADFAGRATARGGWRLACTGESRAGQPYERELASGACVEIFTGAELPRGADAVEMVERVRREGDHVVFTEPVPRGQHVSVQGEIARTGALIYRPRRRLCAADLAVLASIGCDPVAVYARTRVSVLTTGDELVPASARPGRGQIREGNTLFLGAACERAGCEIVRSGIVPDEEAALERAFRAALAESDVLITTGGVSVGKYDLVGATLEKIGVEPVLHKVAVKPGKPLWFGLAGSLPVFGLPGNPVSTLLGFEVFVRAALARMCGADPAEEAERIRRGRWRGKEVRGGDRQNNLPAALIQAADGIDELEPLAFRGSADIVTAARADALAIVPAGGTIRGGELIEYRPLR